MNITVAALKRPFTVLVCVVILLMAGINSVNRMPRDIFPTLGLPVIYVAQPYGGVDPAQMEGFITYYYEYHFLYITGIEHVESKSIQGISLVKLQFQPGTEMSQAMAETISYVNRARAFMPPGTVPPFVMRFDSGSVPIGNLVFSSETRTVPEIQDAALNRVRPLFATLPGVSAPPPFGGSARTIVIRADPDRLRAFHMSPDEIVTALGQANTISPSGNLRIGSKMPLVPTNATVASIKDLESVPIRTGTARTVFIRDIGTVEDSSDIATGYALVNGKRTVYIPVTKRADASTLTVASLVRENMPKFQAALPDGVTVGYEFDQSPVVTRAIMGLFSEGIIGAILTGLMVLLFLRSLRSAAIVILTIPLAVMGAVWALQQLGQTINIMTLGGLALAVGVLVDEATVTIENIHTHISRGSSVKRAALESTLETQAPRLLAMFCILAVLTPALFMSGPLRALFVPLSFAVGCAMIFSYLLSGTLVPLLFAATARGNADTHAASPGTRYAGFVEKALKQGVAVLVVYVLVVAGLGIATFGGIGTEIFSRADSGSIQIRLRAPIGSRIETTEALSLRALESISREAGSKSVDISLGFVGVQPSSYPINTIHLWTGGSDEAVLQVGFKPGSGIHVEDIQDRLRKRFAAELPDAEVSFEPGDIVSRVMSFGSTTPIEVAVAGPALPANREFAQNIKDRLAKIPELRDIRFGQPMDYPTVKVDIDRQRAGLMGLTAADVARAAVVATSSSRFVAPNYWPDPKTGIAYQVQVEIPSAAIKSVEDLRNVPVGSKTGDSALLRDVATVENGTAVGQYDRYNMQRMVTVTANMVGHDLGKVAKSVRAAIKDSGAPPARVSVALRGQIAPMEEMFDGLRTGLIIAVVAVLLMLTAYFQSIRLALVTIFVVPAVLAGVLVALRLTGSSLNIQSFMGAIMAVGVAVSNSILLITQAERQRLAGASSFEAAKLGAASRVRPIVMTAAAMIAGMIPIAIGFGESGDQSAPLGRAVIGGLTAALITTLMVLPVIYAFTQRNAPAKQWTLHPDEEANTASQEEPSK